MITFYRDSMVLLVYCSIIFYLSHQSTLAVPMMLFSHQDKLVHAFAYAVMGALAWRCLGHKVSQLSTLFVASLLFCSLYGVSDEFHQSFIVGRDVDVLDWLADTVGATLMLSFMLRSSQRKLRGRVA